MKSEEKTKRCPYCVELILEKAIKCKHCGSSLLNKPAITPNQHEEPVQSSKPDIDKRQDGLQKTHHEEKNKIIGMVAWSLVVVLIVWLGFTVTRDLGTTSTEQADVEDNSVPREYKSALNKAASYANTMYMSKRGVYDQLTSEYGEKFSAEPAQYAIDNVKADWNANALAKAKNYQNTINMSPSAIHDQLTSEYGEKFTKAEADYAIQHLND